MKFKTDIKTRELVITALFAALICVSTFVIKIPSPLQGYINLGDCFVLLAAWTLSKKLGFISAALGSALADLMAGYVIFVPATFIIKGVMALVAHGIFTEVTEKNQRIACAIVSGAAAEGVMILGYLVYESFLYGVGAAVTGVPFNAIQGVAGLASACAMKSLLNARSVIKC